MRVDRERQSAKGSARGNMTTQNNQSNNPTSEVGCEIQSENQINSEDIMANNNITIENTENNKNSQNNSDLNMWRMILEAQNKNFVDLINIVKSNIPSKQEKVIVLPKFNPEIPGSDVSSWCSTVDLILNGKQIEGSDLIVLLSNSLLGSAGQWLPTICFAGMTWNHFQELLIQRYSGTDTPAAVILSLLKSRPKPTESLANFGSRLVTSLTSSWKNMEIEEIAVSVALAHVARCDSRLQHSVFTTKITTRNELQQELKAFAYAENPMLTRSSEDESPEPKRVKITPKLTCHFCGKIGHKIAECKLMKENNDKIAASNKSSIICFKCGQPGHIAPKCPQKNSGNKPKNFIEKTVNQCSLEPTCVLTQSGESFSFCFDSGAECSLLKESKSSKFSGKRIFNVVRLKGIGNGFTNSTLQILSIVKINDLRFEILFHVVPDNCMKSEVIIGRDILQYNVRVELTANEYKFIDKSVNSCSKIKSKFDLNKINTDLEEEDKPILISMLSEFSKNFIEGVPVTRINSGKLEIRLIDSNKTVQRRAYRLGENERQVVRNKIKELLEAGIIRPSSSPFSSPILLVKKKDGTDRMCVDYRELNSNTVSDKYPLPLISDQIARLRNAKLFTCLDMASGYHQIPVHENSIEYTAFVTPDGQYEYLSMPFGLKNAPSVFQRAVVKALGDLAYSYVIVYMDDIMIVASTKEEALLRLKTVLEILVKAGFSFNIKKCSFLKSCVEYLGFKVTEGEIQPNPRKIKALTELPPPQSITELRQFIGLASYFRQFVYQFSEIMKPLYFLTSSKKFVWKQEHEQIRNKIISILTNKPVLMIFDPQYPIELHTDASSQGYGAILIQRTDNTPHVVEYFSKRTNDYESRYHSYELETLAVVNAVKHFRHYLLGRKFIIYTDCNALKATRTKKELTPRVQRWWAYLQIFDFDILYRNGKRMAHADFFSRNQIPIVVKYTKVEQKHVQLAEISNDWLIAEQQQDLDIISIMNKLQTGELEHSLASTYEVKNGILFRKIQRRGRTFSLPVVPRAFRWAIINNVHESVMHLGYDKTLDKVYDYYWFENMAKYVRKFVENCITCRISKPLSGKVPVELHPIPKISIPWHTVHMDITGKLSGKRDVKEYIIVFIDAFTKYVLLYHTTSIDSVSCIKAAQFAISIFGNPARVIADQGRCFTGKQFTDFCISQNIKLHLIATGASRANGQVERIMSTLKGMLTAVEASKRSWQDSLNEIQLAMNCTTNRITKASPLELLIGKVARPLNLMANDDEENHIDLDSLRKVTAEKIKCNAIYEKVKFDKNKANVIKFNIGDYVLLKAGERHQTKLDPKYRGPFQIIESLENDRYILKSLNTNRTYKYSSEFLRKWPKSTVPNELDIEVEDITDENVERDVNAVIENVGRDVNVAIENVERDVNIEKGKR